MNMMKNKPGHLLPALRCFNVAAICALAVWHAYAFYLHQAIARESVMPGHELRLLPQLPQLPQLPEQTIPSDLRRTV
ncbi:hypothetical protein [Undibacterium sp. Ji49W]|uniref:hypothetical protein n=1 Tax=Undibacterium sp. Ji49W TaxID=3413040 RepID=UPI003BF0EE95